MCEIYTESLVGGGGVHRQKDVMCKDMRLEQISVFVCHLGIIFERVLFKS